MTSTQHRHPTRHQLLRDTVRYGGPLLYGVLTIALILAHTIWSPAILVAGVTTVRLIEKWAQR